MTDKAREALDRWMTLGPRSRATAEVVPTYFGPPNLEPPGMVAASEALEAIGEHAAAGEYLTKAEVRDLLVAAAHDAVISWIECAEWLALELGFIEVGEQLVSREHLEEAEDEADFDYANGGNKW